MAEVRKSGKQAAARKAARDRAVERAAEFRRRQEQLEEFAAEYFVAVDAVDGINEDAEAQIAKIRETATAQAAKARAEADMIVQKMLDTKVTREEVAERLGIPLRDVKRRKPAPAVPAETEDAGAGSAGESTPIRDDEQSNAA